MSDAKQAWDEVGEKFSEVGRLMKQRYDANVAWNDEEKKKVDDALHQMGDALDAGFTTIGDSFRDPSMRDEMKEAGTALGTALSRTFDSVAYEIRKAVGKKS
jgi:hypothetical protein